MVYKPRLVRAEWGSIEAMSGADEDGEAQTVAALLATIGEATSDDEMELLDPETEEKRAKSS